MNIFWWGLNKVLVETEALHAPVELAETFLVEAVPDVDESVGAAGRERVKASVECDRVYGEDLLVSVLLDAVTLERVLLLLYLGTRVEVLDGHPPYDRSEFPREIIITLFIYSW